jgi:hypothetical protein
MERPIIIKPRMVWRGDHSSEKFNLYANQLLVEITRMAAILTEQADALQQDLDKIIDSDLPYPDNSYHPFAADENGNIVLETDSPIIPTMPGGNEGSYNFISIHRINNEYQSAKDRALNILRRLS